MGEHSFQPFVSGWSGRGGLTRNPYALDRNPCGSSSGSGAATAANLCAVAVGTETDGSVVCPSSANGIVGIKPTLGLVSRAGIIPIAHSQDTAGPMARTVRDAAILLSALAEPIRATARPPPAREKSQPTTRDFSIPTDCAARASAWPANISASATRGRSDGQRDGGDEAAGRGAGGSRRSRVVTASSTTPNLLVLLYELKADLNAYLAARPDAAGALAERDHRFQRAQQG